MESLKKEQILQELTARSSALSAFGVEQIGLFGSFVRDEASSNSDIDLLVDIKKEFKTFRNFLALNYYLEDIFKRKVELITKQSLSPYIGPHILNTVEYAVIAG
ncbi:putative nucleotidyltransferase [Pedobacter sp. UYP24]